MEGLHVVKEISKIAEVTDMLKKLVVDEKKKVLLICDIDDTLMRPDVTLGSDTWFSYSLKRAENIHHLVKKLALIYALLEFKAVESGTDEFVQTIDKLHKENDMKYICLTSRNVLFTSYTTIHFKDADYDSVMVRPNLLDIRDPTYIECENPGKKGFTVRYLDNICSVSGRDKGIVTTEIVSRYYENHNDKFDMIIFIDDSISNIEKVNRSLSDPKNNTIYQGTDSICIHYTYMEEHKSKYSINDFIDDTEKIEKLLEFKKYVNS